ncbi:MAG: ATP-binding protein [Gemmatimonadaceae bacterium]|nr:ATP-binding protein [Gemmatimonadaceae bacterium]
MTARARRCSVALGPSVTMRALTARAEDLRRDVSRPVLLVGARGLGKQFLAERIHRASSLAAEPFLMLDARRAADATLRRMLDEAPTGSTILVRHVDELSPAAQALLDQRTRDRGPIARLMATATGDIVARVTACSVFLEVAVRSHPRRPLDAAAGHRAGVEADDLLALSLSGVHQHGGPLCPTCRAAARQPAGVRAAAQYASGPNNLRANWRPRWLWPSSAHVGHPRSGSRTSRSTPATSRCRRRMRRSWTWSGGTCCERWHCSGATRPTRREALASAA